MSRLHWIGSLTRPKAFAGMAGILVLGLAAQGCGGGEGSVQLSKDPDLKAMGTPTRAGNPAKEKTAQPAKKDARPYLPG